MRKKKATCEDIKRIVKKLKKHEVKPNKDGHIGLNLYGNWYTPSTIEQDKKMMKKIKMEYIGII